MRFQPDSWLDAVLRPVAMADPNANVYVELMAPDFRFLFALLLLALLAVLVLARRHRRVAGDAPADRTGARPVFVLAAAVALAFVPWLATSGNGRYFAAGLLAIGPVCVGLARLLPVTRSLRLVLVVGMVALQALAVQQSAPWHAWSMVPWKEAPYFRVDVPEEWRAQPATFVTLAPITYSLVAPRFHPQSRWVSLYNAPAPGTGTPDGRRTEAFLAQAQPGRLMLLAPAVAGRLPGDEVSKALDAQLAPYRLALAQPQSCRFLASPSLAEIGLGQKTQEQRARAGFWLCQLERVQPAAPGPSLAAHRRDAVFRSLEAQCPRLFPAGGDAGTVAIPHGEMRSYLQAEMKAYIYDSGEVYYKYYRALNAVLVGTAEDLLAGRARVDCDHIRGRSGLPWERGI